LTRGGYCTGISQDTVTDLGPSRSKVGDLGAFGLSLDIRAPDVGCPEGIGGVRQGSVSVALFLFRSGAVPEDDAGGEVAGPAANDGSPGVVTWQPWLANIAVGEEAAPPDKAGKVKGKPTGGNVLRSGSVPEDDAGGEVAGPAANDGSSGGVTYPASKAGLANIAVGEEATPPEKT